MKFPLTSGMEISDNLAGLSKLLRSLALHNTSSALPQIGQQAWRADTQPIASQAELQISEAK